MAKCGGMRAIARLVRRSAYTCYNGRLSRTRIVSAKVEDRYDSSSEEMAREYERDR